MKTNITISAKTNLSDADIEALVDRLKVLFEAEKLVEVVFVVMDNNETEHP